jgi:hypothetical protein
MNRRTQMLSFAPALALAVVLAACGGGGGDDEASERDDERTTTTAEDATTTTAPAGTDTTAASDPAAPPSGAPGDVGTALGVDRTFTGEGSASFCAEVQALQSSVGGSDPSRVSEATVTGQMAAMTPPAEIAEDWNLVVSVQQSLTSGSENPLAEVDPAQLEAYGMASAVIATYLGDVCRVSLVP